MLTQYPCGSCHVAIHPSCTPAWDASRLLVTPRKISRRHFLLEYIVATRLKAAVNIPSISPMLSISCPQRTQSPCDKQQTPIDQSIGSEAFASKLTSWSLSRGDRLSCMVVAKAPSHFISFCDFSSTPVGTFSPNSFSLSSFSFFQRMYIALRWVASMVLLLTHDGSKQGSHAISFRPLKCVFSSRSGASPRPKKRSTRQS